LQKCPEGPRVRSNLAEVIQERLTVDRKEPGTPDTVATCKTTERDLRMAGEGLPSVWKILPQKQWQPESGERFTEVVFLNTLLVRRGSSANNPYTGSRRWATLPRRVPASERISR